MTRISLIFYAISWSMILWGGNRAMWRWSKARVDCPQGSSMQSTILSISDLLFVENGTLRDAGYQKIRYHMERTFCRRKIYQIHGREELWGCRCRGGSWTKHPSQSLPPDHSIELNDWRATWGGSCLIFRIGWKTRFYKRQVERRYLELLGMHRVYVDCID